ncbi:MAG: hypothetical protein V3R57_01060 [Candidatus Bathyarchaeia archaeon]
MMEIDFDDVTLDGGPEPVKTQMIPWEDRGKHEEYANQLDRSQNFREVFTLVKKSVKDTLNHERTGLLLYLRDMPLKVGAYHQLGTNGIILNRVLLEQVIQTTASRIEVNAFIYYILLHEYLHTLGYIDERRVRELTYVVAEETFGPTHVATKMAVEGPWSFIKINPFYMPRSYERGIEIVREFEDPSSKYIS